LASKHGNGEIGRVADARRAARKPLLDYHREKQLAAEKALKSFGVEGDLTFGNGSGGFNPGFLHKGYMDNIRVYSRALSSAEVKVLYDYEKP
jgi:hypothetical protein